MADNAGDNPEADLEAVMVAARRAFGGYDSGVSRERERLLVPARESVRVSGTPGLLSVLTHGGAREWARSLGSSISSAPVMVWLVLTVFAAVGTAIVLFGLAFFGLFGEVAAGRLSVDRYGMPTPQWIRYLVIGFGSVFVLVPVAIVGSMVVHAGNQVARTRRGRGARAPWRSDYPWDPKGTAPDYATGYARRAVNFVGVIAVLGVIAIPHAFVLFLEGRPGGGSLGPLPWIVAGAFDVVGVLIIVVYVHAVARWLMQARRYGRIRVRWPTFPSSPGEQLKATVVTQKPVDATGPIRATLRCVQDVLELRDAGRLRVRGKVVRRYTQETLNPYAIYSQTQDLPVSPGSARSSFDLEFDIPPDLPGTDLSAKEPTYWQIVVKVPLSGPDLNAVFLAPVYDRDLLDP